MCSRPEAVRATLPRLRQAFPGSIGAYPDVGYNPMAPVGGRFVHLGPDIMGTQAYGPTRLAEFAQEWIEMGSQIVGGCCDTGPEHIVAVKVVVDGARRRDAWVRLFTDDGVQMPPNARANVGREMIRAWSQTLLTAFRAAFALSVAEVRVAGDWAFERGAYRIALTPRAGGEPIQGAGKYITIYGRPPGGA